MASYLENGHFYLINDIIVLTMEQRRPRQEVQDALHGISERTLERAQAVGLDTMIEWVAALA